MSLKLFIFIFFFISNIFCDINIHIIPHTHLDPGWLNTPEEYYSQKSIDGIFKTVLNSLKNNDQRTFIINEIYYFKIWYESISTYEKEQFKKLISEKRIEFVFCGYVVNDEATPIYYDIMDNIRVGLQFLYEEFDIIPKSAFFLDSFGHSAGNAHIVAQAGFEQLVLGRFHLDYLEYLKKNKRYEFYWEMFGNKSSEKNILTHILALHYGYTLFLPDLENNIDRIMPSFISKLKEIYDGIHHKNLLFLYGDDFKFETDYLFKNIDDLITKFNDNQDDAKKYFNTGEKVNIFYSTPEKYFTMMKKELEENNKNLETVTNKDFYPLRTDCYWTGYFTSRPFLKGYIRKASNIFYALSKYFAFNKFINDFSPKDVYKNLKEFRETLALTQHHDAITGTCKQYVGSDYVSRLKDKIKNSENDFKENIIQKLGIKIEKICYNNYITENNDCSNEFLISNKNDNIKIGLYNPLYTTQSSDETNLLINIEISDSEYEYEIENIKSNFFCINDKNIKDINLFKYKSKCFLNFFMNFKKGEEFSYITLKKTSNLLTIKNYVNLNNIEEEKIQLIKDTSNIKYLSLNVEDFSFNLNYKNEGNKISEINFQYYDGMYYVNAGSCTDGAYIFSPYNRYPDQLSIEKENSFYYKGDIGITFVTRNYMSSFTIFTIFYEPFFAKVEHIFDNLNENYFLKRFSFAYNFVIKTDINNIDSTTNKPIFYTDANGLEPMKRTVDKFEYEETASPSTGGNFYPVTSYISIEDNENKNIISLFTDRPQAGSGYLPGSVSLTLQRMSYGTDNKGMNENMNEDESMKNDDFKTTHIVIFGKNINQGKNYMEMKTDTLNMVYNYLNKATILFKIDSVKDDIIIQKMNKNNELINDMINKYISISWDIRTNYQIINEKLIIGQYFRYNNYLFNNEKMKEDDSMFGLVKINFDKECKFKVYWDKTGYNYKLKDINMFSDEIKKQFKEPNDINISLKYNEFVFVYYYFEN